MADQNLKIIIVGAGIAGFTASIYASRYNLPNVVIGEEPGGQIMGAHIIENYPGFAKISGAKLMQKCREQTTDLGAKVITGIVANIQKINNKFIATLKDNSTYEAPSVLLAMGTKYRRLEIPGEKEFTGRGVSYCFTCDGMFFRDKIVAVIGGGNSAALSVEYLKKIVKKVYLIHRGAKLRCTPAICDYLEKDPQVEILYNTNIIKIQGDNIVRSVKLDNPYQGNKTLDLDGIFIEIGAVPNFVLAQNLGVEMNETGHVKIKPDQSTNVPGVFAAGDITNGSNNFRQLVTAASEGAIAALSIYQYLK